MAIDKFKTKAFSGFATPLVLKRGVIERVAKQVGSRGESYALEGGATTTANVKQISRQRHMIYARSDALKLGFDPYWLDTNLEVLASNDYNVQAVIEIGSKTGRFKWGNTGNTGVVSIVADPTFLYQSDWLDVQQAFGVPYIDEDTLVWLRLLRQVNVGEKFMFKTAAADTDPIAGEVFMTGASDAPETLLDATGAMATGNGWSTATHTWFPANLLGNKTDKLYCVPSLGASGASDQDGVGEPAGDGSQLYGGALRKAAFAAKLPRFNVAKGGESMAGWNANNTRRMAKLLAYSDIVLFGQVGNDYAAGATAAQALTRVRTAHSTFKAAAAALGKYIPTIQLAATTKTDKIDSTKAWTVDNQNPRAGFALNGNFKPVFDSTLKAEAGWGNTIDVFLDHTGAIVSPLNNAVFDDLFTVDGTHLSTIGHNANDTKALRPAFQALRAAWKAGLRQATITSPDLPQPAPSAPSLKTKPIIDGSPRVGNTLTSTDAVILGYPTPIKTVQRWRADGVIISGATAGTLALVAAQLTKQIIKEEVWQNTEGSITVQSDATAAVQEAQTGYDPASEIVFAQRTDLSAAKKSAIDTFLKKLKELDVYNRLDVLQFHQVGLFNWIDPTKFNATLGVNNVRTDGAGIFTTTDANGFVSTGFNPFNANGKFTSQDASIFFGISAGGLANTSSIAGFYDGSKGITLAPHTGSNLTFRMNTAVGKTISQAAPNGGNGIFSMDRLGANCDMYSNGVKNAYVTDAAPATIPDGAIRLGSISGTTAYARCWDFFAAGSRLTEEQHLGVHAALNALRAAFNAPGEYVLDSSAVPFFAAMTGPALSDEQKKWVSEAIVEWKASALWSMLVSVCLPLQDSQASRINLKNPATVESPINSLAFTPFRGFTGDGASSFLDSGIAMDTAPLAQNSLTLYAYVNATSSDVQSTAPTAGMDTTTGVISFLRPRSSPSGTLQGRVNATGTTSDGGTTATRLGGSAISRSASNSLRFYRDGVLSGSEVTTVASSAPQAGKTVQWLRLGASYNGLDRLAARMIAPSMTPAQISSFHNGLVTLLTKLGAN